MQILMTYAHKWPLEVHIPVQVKNLNLSINYTYDFGNILFC